MSVLGIDVGTSTCKGIVLSSAGKILAQAYQNYTKKPAIFEDKAEIDAEVFKEGVFSVIKKLASEVKDKDAIQAIALSTHGETLIPVDKDGKPLRPAMLSMDRRCVAQKERIAEKIGEKRFYAICGTPLHTQYPMPKILWLKENEPQTVEKTATFCTTQDYLHLALGVGRFVDYSLASRFGGLDIRQRNWSSEILQVVGVTAEQFSTPAKSGKVIGQIPTAIARELGLDNGVSVVLGGHDQPCSALGMGAKDGVITVSAGSYECLSVATDEPLNDEKGYAYGLNSYCHVLDNKYVTLAFFASGLTVSWFIDTFCQGKYTFAELEALAPTTNTGICFTPHVYGSMNPCWNDKAKAKIVGATAQTTIGGLYKALLEGASCELDLNVQVLEKLSGVSKQLTFCGGGTKSNLWMELRADILNREIERLDGGVDCSCMGACILAGLGVGVFKDAETAIKTLDYAKTVFSPKNADGYALQKAEYKQVTGVQI